ERIRSENASERPHLGQTLLLRRKTAVVVDAFPGIGRAPASAGPCRLAPLPARPALGVSVGEQQSHYCNTEQDKTDRAHGSSPSPSFRSDLRFKNGAVCEAFGEQSKVCGNWPREQSDDVGYATIIAAIIGFVGGLLSCRLASIHSVTGPGVSLRNPITATRISRSSLRIFFSVSAISFRTAIFCSSLFCCSAIGLSFPSGSF